MATQVQVKVTGSLLFNPTTGGVGRLAKRWGDVSMPSGLIRLFEGTGNTEIDKAMVNNFTILTTANLDINLKTGQTNVFTGVDLVLTAVKFFYLELTSPLTTDFLWVGPQNVTDAAALWFDGVTATYKEKVSSKSIHTFENGAGWAIGASTKIVRLNNPGAATVSGVLVIAGI